MTNEDILEKLLRKRIFDYLHTGSMKLTDKEINSAMDAAREDEAVAILEWYDKLSPAEKCTVHPPAGSGGSTGIYNLSYKQLYRSYLKHKNEKL